MTPVIKASLVLVGLVTLLSAVLQLSGVNSDFMLGQTVFLAGAIAINVAVIFWALSQTASIASYGAQVGKAAAIGAIGGALIIVASWCLLTFVFPNALRELADAAVAWMDTQEMQPAEYDKQVAAIQNTTAMSQSIPGGVGTFFTSLVSGAVIAVFKRRR